MMAMAQRSLDRWSQDPAFTAVQDSWRTARPGEWDWYFQAILQMARSRGDRGFAVEDVTDALGRDKVPENLPGAVSGYMRGAGILVVIDRRKSNHPAAKGRWINVYKLHEKFAAEPPKNPHAPPKE